MGLSWPPSFKRIATRSQNRFDLLGWWTTFIPPCSCDKTYVSYAIIKPHQSADIQTQQQRSIARTIQTALNSISTLKWVVMLTFPLPLSTNDSQSRSARAPATMNNSNCNTYEEYSRCKALLGKVHPKTP